MKEKNKKIFNEIIEEVNKVIKTIYTLFLFGLAIGLIVLFYYALKFLNLII